MTAAPAEARCFTHPEVLATGACARCGVFFCADDRAVVDLVSYCRTCAVRPDVDWIEAYRQKYWGRRDSWALLFGLSSLVYLAVATNLAFFAVGSLRLVAIPAALSAVTGVLFFLGKPIARPLLVASVGLWTALAVAFNGPWGLASMVVPTLVVIAALFNTRNRLFFKQEVSRSALKADYQRLADNRLAQNSGALGGLGLLVPLVGVVAVITGTIALRRVNPDAKPPIGKKGHALAGIVLGALGTLLWVSIAIAGMTR